MKGIMIQGTASDVGKSVLVTAICRMLTNKGYHVVPFKSQNMSNNSYVTKDGKEIGRAQGIQAEACNVEANVYMNPILLKPNSQMSSEVVRLGIAERRLSGKEYREHYYEIGIETIKQSLNELKQMADLVVIEGAGSPAEVNLNDREIVNMKVAELADVPVILVADIERGGVFASIIGTLMLLKEHERKRVKGILINKFRGDVSLFASGIQFLEEKTGVPVLGVIPHLSNLEIDSEDSLALSHYKNHSRHLDPAVHIGVLKPPYISNHTDVEPFLYEKDVCLHLIDDPKELEQMDAIILPGTKSTISDFIYFYERGFKESILRFMKEGGRIAGICGGYQMLGEQLIDEAGTDTGETGKTIQGFSIFPMITTFQKEKTTVRVEGTTHEESGFSSCPVNGYEIHLGQTQFKKAISPLFKQRKKDEGISLLHGRVIGTYMHHLFFNDAFRTEWLNKIRLEKGMKTKPVQNRHGKKAQAYDRLAKEVEQSIDVEKLIEMIEQWGNEDGKN